MQIATFHTQCDVELGDQVRLTSGTITEIADIRTVHYLRDHKVEFEFEMANVPGLWYTRQGFVYPVPPIAIHADWVIPEITPEMCSNCMREVEIPGNEPSKCPGCGDDILPCSTCYDEIDGKKSCDWNENAGCWRFPKTVSATPKRYVDNRGWIYFVRAGIGGNTFKTFYKKDPKKPAGMGEHGYRNTPWCETFDHAQKNLDALALVHGWKEISAN